MSYAAWRNSSTTGATPIANHRPVASRLRRHGAVDSVRAGQMTATLGADCRIDEAARR